MKTIMIVGREENRLYEMKLLLQKENIELISVSNSRQAIKKINEEKEKNIDLILVNTQIPGQNKSSFCSIKPNTKLSIHNYSKNCLLIPFTINDFVNFVKEKIYR